MTGTSRTRRQAGRTGSRAVGCEPLEQRLALSATVLASTIEAINMDSQVTASGIYTAPPNPSAAAGPNHVVNVVYSMVQWYTKSGTLQVSKRLGKNSSDSVTGSFFESLSPVSVVSQPKVIYDQYFGRFVVTALDLGTPTSRILVAVSDDADPNGTWYFKALDANFNVGGAACHVDSPGLGLSSDGIYVTANLTNSATSAFSGSRLWVLVKSGWYTGGALTFTLMNPTSNGGQINPGLPMQPAHMYGFSLFNNFLVCTGFRLPPPFDPNEEWISLFQISGSATAPQASGHIIYEAYDVDTSPGITTLPGTAQPGTAAQLVTGSNQLQNAVYRDGYIWTTNTVLPPSGPDAGTPTAHWYKLKLGDSIVDQGNVGGEEIAADTRTFFPSVMVDAANRMVLGFAAAGPNTNPGAYYTTRLASDPAGTVQPSTALAAGVTYFDQPPANPWGHYSSTALDPTDQATFWLYNGYAQALGPNIPGGGSGRWGTRYGKVQVPGAMSGVTFWDFNLNGDKDGSEPALPGASVWVDLNDNGSIDAAEPTTTSAADGSYSFTDLPPGTHNVRQTAPAGYFASPRSVTVNSNATTTGADLGAVATIYTGTASNDDYLLRAAPGGQALQVLIDGVVAYVLPTSVSRLTFNLGDSDDTFTVDYANGTAVPAAGVVFNGNTGTDALVVNGSGSADVFTADGGAVTRIGSGGGTEHIFVETVTINGLAGADTFQLHTLPSGVFGASAVLNGGDDGDQFTIANGNLGDVQSPVTVTGGNGTDTVLLKDGAQTLSDSYLITASTVQRAGFGGLTYSGLEGLNLQGQTGNNAYFVLQTAAATPITITDLEGNDSFDVGFFDLSGVLANVTFNAGSGTDSVKVIDNSNPNNDTYTIFPNVITRPSIGAVVFTSMESVTLQGGSGNNTYNISTLNVNSPLTITDSGGSDTFNLGAANLGNLASMVTINAGSGAGTDSILLDDSLNPTPATYNITDTTVARSGFGGLTYSNFESLALKAGTGNDEIVVQSTLAGMIVNIDGYGGQDIIRANETAPDAPVHLIGSTGNDTVIMNSDGVGSGTVVFDQSQTIGTMFGAAGALARITAGSGAVLRLINPPFFIGNGRLDLTDNALIVEYTGASVANTVRNLLKVGRSGGAWNGGGIMTSAAASLPGTGLGYFDNNTAAPLSTFLGQSVNPTSILVRYTYDGDTNLDGGVDITDLGSLATNWQTNNVWRGGDFNYDDTVNITDLGMLATNWQVNLPAQAPARPAATRNHTRALDLAGLAAAS